ncbi:DUF397 domain-containing protein [Streptomyces canus]|uniref:DUF397 domain-containing protein n=1 Tax=Streptomyces canus TaxID=58343 RepID=UPI002E3150AE|nr:DUF397 domain-containing protein [Streptomyces canus]
MIRKTSAEDASELMWFKSSYSDTSNPNDCVEIATTPSTIYVRDSKHTVGPSLKLTREAWASFVPYASES